MYIFWKYLLFIFKFSERLILKCTQVLLTWVPGRGGHTYISHPTEERSWCLLPHWKRENLLCVWNAESKTLEKKASLQRCKNKGRRAGAVTLYIKQTWFRWHCSTNTVASKWSNGNGFIIKKNPRQTDIDKWLELRSWKFYWNKQN